mgnify:FL=1
MYFLDRLARRLVVEQLEKKGRLATFDSAIFQLLLLNRSILTQIMQEFRNPKKFTVGDWKKLKADG